MMNFAKKPDGSILKNNKYPHFKGGGPDLPPYGGVGVNQVSIR